MPENKKQSLDDAQGQLMAWAHRGDEESLKKLEDLRMPPSLNCKNWTWTGACTAKS